jgi:hypothetical protein
MMAAGLELGLALGQHHGHVHRLPRLICQPLQPSRTTCRRPSEVPFALLRLIKAIQANLQVGSMSFQAQ